MERKATQLDDGIVPALVLVEPKDDCANRRPTQRYRRYHRLIDGFACICCDGGVVRIQSRRLAGLLKQLSNAPEEIHGEQ
jgi:hypothetical protein